MRNLILVAVFGLISSTLASGNPVLTKKDAAPKEPEPPPVPSVAFTCQFGVIKQEGRNIQITGHPSWDAIGVLRSDGKVQIIWTRSGSPEPYPAVYEVSPGKMVGHYGPASSAYIDDNGELAGTRNNETLAKVAPPD